ncbi:MAG: GAF domain-containing protein, partial [Pseudomonadaceae bacterium]|nr:GAF domain-containing protein [Pseudomonadaceae bacterium]
MAFRRVPLYVHISYFFVCLIVIFATVNLAHQYLQSRELVLKDAQLRFSVIGQLTEQEFEGLFRPAALSTELLAEQRLMFAKNLEERLASVPFLARLLNAQPSASGAFAGYTNGDFFWLRPAHIDAGKLETIKPPSGTVWVVESIQQELSPGVEHLFLNENLAIIGRSTSPDIHFDPRQLPWYQQAMHAGQLVQIEPYISKITKKLNLGFAKPMQNAAGVVGVALSLDSIEQLLRSALFTPDMRIAIVNQDGEVISSHAGNKFVVREDGSLQLAKLEEMALPMLQQLALEGTTRKTDTLTFVRDGEDWQGMRVDLPAMDGGKQSLWMAAPHSELLADAIALRNRGALISLVFLLLGIAGAMLLARMAAKPLDALSREAHKIEQFDFSEPIQVKSYIAEIIDLAHAMGNMKSTIQRFLQLSTALSSETNFQRLLARILTEMQQVTGAAGALVYLADSDATNLQLTRVLWGSDLRDVEDAAAVSLTANQSHPLVRALRNAPEQPKVLAAGELQQLFAVESAQPLTLWSIALNNRDGRLLGCLALLIDERRQAISPELIAFVNALSSTAAVALNTQRLIDEQKNLLESFIQLIAGAIDAKSPYTGGHCQRVPELTKMLARAACEANEGPFRDFSLSEDEWEAVHIGAWLHDCGKVTTPEFVVDKATKLETLYDRIHEIRMRFEVLKRDAELAYWQGIAAGGEHLALQEQLEQQLRQLDDDFAFVAQCNEGGEFMAPERVERMQALAQRSWRRTLSDRIGISQDEGARKRLMEEPALPVMEPLLADRPDHVFVRSERDKLADDNPWGFKVKVPEHLYNRGELYNLCIGRGTLAEEERYKINEHMIQTIIMLDKLPFPQHLQAVPEIAGGHHEKMDGTGYPKRLKREEMSIPARMMAIADIFEALTAGDRPYKKAKSLSEALKIMSFMRKDQ